MRMGAVAVAAALALAPMQASTQERPGEFSVGKMLEFCSEPIGNPLKTHCFSYLDGFSDALILVGSKGHGAACIPDGVTTKQMAAVFVLWADKNPQLHHIAYPAGIFLALSEAFPCQQADGRE